MTALYLSSFGSRTSRLSYAYLFSNKIGQLNSTQGTSPRPSHSDPAQD